MEWNVYVEDWNGNEIRVFNVFDHWRFSEDVAKLARKRGLTKETFAEKIKSNLMYYFWSKCEWEIILDSWPQHDDGRFQQKKIDVYDQVSLNFDRFVDYCWAHRSELKKLDKEDDG